VLISEAIVAQTLQNTTLAIHFSAVINQRVWVILQSTAFTADEVDKAPMIAKRPTFGSRFADQDGNWPNTTSEAGNRSSRRVVVDADV
jgi:hypothetical protein